MVNFAVFCMDIPITMFMYKVLAPHYFKNIHKFEFTITICHYVVD